MTAFKSKLVAWFACAMLISGCTTSADFSKFVGEWALDIDSTMSEIVSLRLDVSANSLADMKTALTQQTPQMIINKQAIQITLKDATTKLNATLLSQKGDCAIILVDGKHQMQYCLSGAYLRIKNTNSDKSTITEVYKRIIK